MRLYRKLSLLDMQERHSLPVILKYPCTFLGARDSLKRELLAARKMERLNKHLRTLEKPRWGFHGERTSF